MKTCIFSQIKNEHLYLNEWIEFQLRQGFDKIFLVEDRGSRTHASLIGKYGDKVELFTYEDINNASLEEGVNFLCRQDRAFEWFMDREFNKGNYDWCLFTDDDEYLEFELANETLESFLSQYNNYPAIALYWKCYGANGHYKREKGTVEELYKNESNIFIPHQIKQTKILVNLNYSGEREHFWGVHIFNNAVNTEGKLIDFNISQENNLCYKGAWINHYRTKSFEDWIIKISRGFVKGTTKDINKFFEWNKKMSPNSPDAKKYISRIQ